MTTLQDVLTPEIRRFCEDEKLEPHLKRALELIEEHFPDAQGLHAELVWNPEYPDDTWVSLMVTLSGSLSQIIERDDRFVDDWIARIPWPESDKIVVDLDIV